MYMLFLLMFSIFFQAYGLQRVVGGFETPYEYGKFHVSLQNRTGHHVCGGAIISQRYIVTAAHCVNGIKPKYITAVFGTANLDKGGLSYEIKEILVHENYNASLRVNDIAVLMLDDLIDFNIAEMLRFDEVELNIGDMVLLTGFGASKPYGESSRKLYGINLTVFDQDICNYAMRYTRKVYDSMFCTFTKIGEGSCHGDSGGPLTIGNRLIGIVSWGIPCAVGFPDVHTRISSYVQWIRNIINRKVCNYCKT